jgi:hypothetical protein
LAAASDRYDCRRVGCDNRIVERRDARFANNCASNPAGDNPGATKHEIANARHSATSQKAACPKQRRTRQRSTQKAARLAADELRRGESSSNRVTYRVLLVDLVIGGNCIDTETGDTQCFAAKPNGSVVEDGKRVAR